MLIQVTLLVIGASAFGVDFPYHIPDSVSLKGRSELYSSQRAYLLAQCRLKSRYNLSNTLSWCSCSFRGGS